MYPRDYLRSMSQSLYMAGIMVGSFVSGLASDRFGRKRITLLAVRDPATSATSHIYILTSSPSIPS